MGLNSLGLFVGLTNRPTAEINRDHRSRGLLVLDALAAESASAVAARMRETRQDLEGSYNPFHLRYADGSSTYLTWLDERGAQTRELEPGVQVICNRDEDDPGSHKVSGIRASVENIDLGAPLDTVMSGLGAVLGSHADPQSPLENACVHTSEYGTRSSSVLAVGESRSEYFYADGSPCNTKYANYTRLLDEIR